MSGALIRLLITLVIVGLTIGVDSTQAFFRDASYSATLEDTRGTVLPTYVRGGKAYVLGEYGKRYNIRIHNHTGRRVEAVVSVDGRDVVSGEVGDDTEERGYVLNPYGTVLIEGFRQSNSNVAAFRFTDPGNSDSSRMGTPQNVGVIGVSLFPEKQHPYPYRRRMTPPQAPGSASRSRDTGGTRADEATRGSERYGAAPATKSESEARGGSGCAGCGGDRSAERSYPGNRNNLGTEYAEDHYSPVRQVDFERENRVLPAQLLVLYYDDRAGLNSRGIIVEPPSYLEHAREPFPDSRIAPSPP
jgi:hypothetical protein